MAGAAALSQLICLASTKLPPPLPRPPMHLSTCFPLTRHCSDSSLSHRTKPSFCVCHGKLNGPDGEEADEVGESFFDGEEVMEDDDSDSDDDSESSVDLLFRFVQSMFKKISKRARKASRSVLPDVISPQLVSFAVDGVLLLASLSILKALLEVVCSLGGTVFVAILLLRVVWAAVSYFQSSGNNYNQSGTSYGRT